jgi:hypothetical protein
MPTFKVLCRRNLTLLAALLILTPAFANAANLNDLLGKKELDETERQETIQRIESIQEKLKLLQEKLRVLERRKADKEAVQTSEGSGAAPAPAGQVNWLPVDETTTSPGDFGMYTYLLFKGDAANTSAIGVLEDFILTIETLPANDIPAESANRFLVPVEKPQSLVKLARQPYDFKLNEAYLRRLELQENLPDGPVLISTSEPLDPAGSGRIPLFLAVSLGRQTPERALALVRIWHNQESDAVSGDTLPVSKLFWDVIDGAGPTLVTRYQQRILVTLPQQ